MKLPEDFWILQKPNTDGSRPEHFIINSLEYPGKYAYQHIHLVNYDSIKDELRKIVNEKESLQQRIKEHTSEISILAEKMSKLIEEHLHERYADDPMVFILNEYKELIKKK